MTAMLKSLRRPMARTLWGSMARERLHPPLIMRQGTAWYRSDRLITLNGSTVSAWGDLTGNSNDATQGTEANQPTYTQSAINGKPGLTFDGSADFMRADGVASVFSGSDKPFTVAIVANMETVDGNFYTIFSAGKSDSADPFIEPIRVESSNEWGAFKQDDAVSNIRQRSGTADTNAHGLMTSSPGTTVTIREDGTKIVDGGGFDVGQTTLDQVAIGARISNSSIALRAHVVIAELAVWDRALTDDEALSVNNYFTNRYGL